MEKPKSSVPSVRIENILNREGDQLPFGYFSTDNETVSWNCGYDQDGKITSVFSCSEDKSNRKITYLPDLKTAIHVRDTLIDAGWKPLKPPELTMKHADGSEKPLNRKQKRYLAKTLAKAAQNSPFENEESK